MQKKKTRQAIQLE